ncbi:MAG: PEP-CTERM sorting domain-containing protein [Candidatus Solibacter sp.]|nr:PEP-CTERM sorting domain-containing protein [Candidatus Solibacter sp.]
MMKKSLVVLVAMAGLLMPGAAFAGSYTFDINSNLKNAVAGTDSRGMDHTLAYAWNLSGFSLGGQTITGASLSLVNINNYNSSNNSLFVYLAATSAYIPGTSGGGTGSVACAGACGFSLTPDDPAVPTGALGIGTIQGHTTYYTDNSAGTTINDEWDLADGATDPLYSAAVGSSLSAVSTSAGRVALKTWTNLTGPPANFSDTYNFDATQIAALATFIGTGTGDFALLMDSDCHYYFDNIQFTLTTSSPVPEPGSVLLLLTVLGGVGLGLRRKKAGSPA